MHTKRILASPTVLGIWSELAPRPGRLEETLRITVAALLVAVVMLTFRMPYLFVGPYLVFILSQRETMLTRALAIASLLMVAIALRLGLCGSPSRLECRLAARIAACACVFHGLFRHADNRAARDSPRAARDLFAVCLRL